MLYPDEIHKVYTNNVETFYKVAADLDPAQIDEYIRACVIGLWSKSGGVTEANVAIINELYSKGQPKPRFLYWELTGSICSYTTFSIPDFFTNIVFKDKSKKNIASRTFIRVLANILLTIATADDDVSAAEARFISTCTEAMESVCDKSGVPAAKRPLNAMDYISSPENPFLDTSKTAASKSETQKPEESNQIESKAKEDELPSLEDQIKQLDSLIGLNKIKKDVKSLVNLIKVRKLRIENNLTVPPISLHMVFMGNPGTGKTTVARLLSGIYRALGVLPKGQLVEVDRSKLVAGYVGQTAIKTAEAIEKAKGGILFIDEAYSLTPDGSGNDYGREAVEIILKSMEDLRDDLVVIVAGYQDLIEKFISSNPGLESRFSKYFIFEDYTGEQLYDIFLSQCGKNQYNLSPEAADKAKSLFIELYKNRGSNFGNARDVRNIFEHSIALQSDRVASMELPSKEDLQTLLKDDIEFVV